MGLFFSVEHANLVAYLTTTGRNPPRVSFGELHSFLVLLAGEGEEAPDQLFSSSSHWVDKVKRSAVMGKKGLDEIQNWHEPVPEDEVERRLALLRSALSGYHLFGLAVGNWEDNKQLSAFTTHAAIDSGPHALFLIPQTWDARHSFELQDPFPAIALAAERSDEWPGIVFWSSQGLAAFAPLGEAKNLYHELAPALSIPQHVDEILERWRRRSEKASILQLSDLHFGNNWAQEKEPFVSTHLHSISGTVARVVITGDLFDEPRPEQARAWLTFRTTLERERRDEAVVIPGNHDQKWRGNLGLDQREIESKVEWSGVFVDEKTSCVFFCFDSSRDADLARGKVTTGQRLQVGTQFDNLILRRPEIKDYLRVALIHHHPFSFEIHKEKLVSRLFEKIEEKYFLRMEDAESFLAWCANRGISLILHGHKHVPRYRVDRIELASGEDRLVTTVGCGTSLGAEGKPLSYNTVYWNPQARRWSVSYFVSPPDGGGFRPDYFSKPGVVG